MDCSLEETALAAYVERQAGAFFPDADGLPAIADVVPAALARLGRCLEATAPGRKHLWRDGAPYFDHRQSDVYAMFLALAANQAHRQSAPRATAEKLFLLNKALHAIDVFYEVDLPDVFVLSHAVGTVLGRATYGDHLLVYQGVTVGSSHNTGDYPTIGEHVSLYAGATVLGRCTIGDGATLAAGALLVNADVPAGHRYSGRPGDARVVVRDRRDPVWG